MSVKNTMSDHCTTNEVFQHPDWKELLPSVVSNWTDKKECLGDMVIFCCKVHPPMTFAE